MLWWTVGRKGAIVRNLFDQYEQPENKLTHALFSTLDHERGYLRPFLQYLGLLDVPAVRSLRITEQEVPGLPQSDAEDVDNSGLPDACVFTNEGWAVLFECKVQARVGVEQLLRHRKTAIRHGFESPHLVIVAVDEAAGTAPDGTIRITWRDVYCWFSRRSHEPWARELIRYMQTFERKMLARDYEIRGTITVFDGLRFDAENPYTYSEGKRLVRLLGDQLQKRTDLRQFGVDPKGKRRPAITGSRTDRVWDFLPLEVARNAKQFTWYPHLTMALGGSWAVAAVTIPNGVKGGFRTKLGALGVDGFMKLMTELENRLRSVIKRSPRAKAVIYVTQRHYKTQSSPAEVDARLEADLRTVVTGNKAGVKYQPEWVAAIFEVLMNKRSNLQLGIEVRLSYECPLLRSAAAVDLFADSWKALAPLLSLVLTDQ